MVKPNSMGYDRLMRAYNMKRAAHSKLEETCLDELEAKRWQQRQREKQDHETHLYLFHKRKEPYYLLYEILNSINKTPNRTQTISKIQYECAMSWCQMKYYFMVLERGALIERHEAYGVDSKRKHVLLSITFKGELYLIKYRDLKKHCFDKSDRLNLFGEIKI